ncbi:MAG: glycosyltransferase family 2 protein [Elusimicrobia bacterium]|nr:glycosyltransferase family 2 protein [Elusimicrobiota bacterium]
MPSPSFAATVIVPVRDLLDRTRRCLESVRAHSRPPYELVVVDNASQAPTRRWLEARARAGELRLIRNEENRSFAASINQGMAAARSDLFVWLNNDAAVGPEWLERLSGCLRRNPGAGAAGPCTSVPPAVEYARFPAFAAAWALRWDGRWKSMRVLSGFCLAVTREAAEAAGPLDERFLWGEEDTDYCLRLRREGFSLLLARDVFVHHEGSVSRRLVDPAVRRKHNRSNRALLREKWSGEARPLRDDAFAASRQPA